MVTEKSMSTQIADSSFMEIGNPEARNIKCLEGLFRLRYKPTLGWLFFKIKRKIKYCDMRFIPD